MAGETAAQARPLEFAAFKLAIDPLIAASVERHLAACRGLNLDPAVMDLITYGANMALAGGKRIRPYVAFLSYASSNGRDDAAVLPALVGLELFHLFALIHDDWMDHGTTTHS
jgi:geranylgeranyl diphosphate synthase type I